MEKASFECHAGATTRFSSTPRSYPRLASEGVSIPPRGIFPIERALKPSHAVAVPARTRHARRAPRSRVSFANDPSFGRVSCNLSRPVQRACPSVTAHRERGLRITNLSCPVIIPSNTRGSQGPRRDGRGIQGERKRHCTGPSEGCGAPGRRGHPLLSRGCIFAAVFLQLHLPLSSAPIANVTHHVASLRTSCVDHEDGPCIRIAVVWGASNSERRPRVAKGEERRRRAAEREGGAEKRETDDGHGLRKGIYS